MSAPDNCALWIEHLRVAQLRQFRQPFELPALQPGLNLIAGPNEAGKSTLARAIRAAFFERHRSTSVDDLRPWGDAGAAPTIELDFHWQGQPYRLAKSFLAKKRCSLRMGSHTLLEGVDAEDHLADTFGFRFASRGASQPEHWGIPGLLWVEQGSGQDIPVDHARDHLHRALASMASASDEPEASASADPPTGLGALAASVGDALVTQLRSQRAELLTSTGKPRAALAQAQVDLDQATTALLALDQRLASYRQQVDQLAAWQAAYQADEAQRPWERLRQELQQAQLRQAALQQAEQQLVQDRTRLAQQGQTAELLQTQLRSWAEQQTSAEQRQRALTSATQALATADAALAHARQAAARSTQQAHTAREQWRQVRQAATRAALAQEAEQARTGAALQAENLRRAEAEHTRLQTLQQALLSVALPAQAVGQLRQRDQRLRELAMQCQAVATQLRYVLNPGCQLALRTEAGAEPLQGTGEHWLSAPATLVLPGLGEVQITPGGQDLADLQRRHAQAQQAFQDALHAAGVADLTEVEARLARAASLDTERQLASQALGLVAPQGLEALRQAVAQCAAQAQSTQDALARWPQAEAAEPGLPLAQAEAAHEAASAAEQRAQATWAQAQSTQAAAQAHREGVQREWAAAQSLLDDPSRTARVAEAQAQWLAVQTERQALAARVEQGLALLREARPEIVAQDIQRLARSIEQGERAHQQRREDLLLLAQSLEKDGAQGLDEQRLACATEQAHAERRHHELQRRAAALDLLCRRLEAHRSATLARWQAPLQQRLQHYLPLLFPGGAQLQINEQLAPAALSRTVAVASGRALPGESSDFDALSFGAREQLGLITRLAYADLLRDAGRPTLIILDDALVHSDAQRLAQMKRVLFDAAQRHQVLLFTCHEEDWRDMGVAPIRL